MRFLFLAFGVCAFTAVAISAQSGTAQAQDLFVTPKTTEQPASDNSSTQKKTTEPPQLYVKPQNNFIRSRTAGQNSNSSIYNGKPSTARAAQKPAARTEPRNKQLEDIQAENIRVAEERAAANNARVQQDRANRKASRQQMVEMHIAQVEAEKAAEQTLEQRAAGGDAAPAAGGNAAGSGANTVYVPNTSPSGEKPARIFNILQ